MNAEDRIRNAMTMVETGARFEFDKDSKFAQALRDLLAEKQRASDLVGPWLSAALDDPNVCAAMKQDIADWMEIHHGGTDAEN